jgi:transposase InsO family protein
VRGMPILAVSDFHKCDHCMACKAKKNGRGHRGIQIDTPSCQPLAILHGDLGGPMRCEGLDGNSYFLIVVDDFTGKIFTRPLKGNGDTHAVFRDLIIEVNSHSPAGYKARRFHSDNGSEFTSEAFRTVCQEYNITQTFANAYCPTQNPVAERAIGSLHGLAVTAMVAAGSHRKLWYRALNQAAKVLNSFPKNNEEIPVWLQGRRI